MELYDQVIAKYMASRGPLLEEEQREVEKLLNEAREMPIPEQVTHQECEVPQVESGGEAGCEDDEELDPTDARRYRKLQRLATAHCRRRQPSRRHNACTCLCTQTPEAVAMELASLATWQPRCDKKRASAEQGSARGTDETLESVPCTACI